MKRVVTTSHAPTCPCCMKPAQLVTRAELHPFREDNTKLADFYYACCGHICAAFPETFMPRGRLRGYVSRRLREEANIALNRLASASSFLPDHAAFRRARGEIARRLGKPDLRISTADADTCRQIIAACEAATNAAWSPANFQCDRRAA